MEKMFKLTMLSLAVALLVFGCSNDTDQYPSLTGSQMAAGYTLPVGATFVSASLNVYVNQASGNTVTLRRITADWDELTVTYNSFGGAFDAASEGSFVANAIGWEVVDITALVAAWMDGTYANYGVLMEHDDLVWPRTELNSREASDFQPFLEVCYTTAGGPACDMVPALGDASIMANYPDGNTGAIPELFVGWHDATQLEKQALIRFCLDVEPPEETGECDGKVTQLTVCYGGAIVDAHITVFGKARGHQVPVFDGIIQPGECFTFNGTDRHGTFGPETYYYVNGVYNTNIHTSCSQPIGPGLVSGDFTVIEGYSRHGGLLPPL